MHACVYAACILLPNAACVKQYDAVVQTTFPNSPHVSYMPAFSYVCMHPRNPLCQRNLMSRVSTQLQNARYMDLVDGLYYIERSSLLPTLAMLMSILRVL